MAKPYNPVGYDEGNHWGWNEFDVKCVAVEIYNQCKKYGINIQPRPLSAILGNCSHEGSFHTGMWEGLVVGRYDRGYGLFQWTPATKVIDYLEGKGIPIDSLSGQIERFINFECLVNPSQQWSQARSTLGNTFRSFLEDTTHEINALVEDFMWGYENPNSATAALTERQNYANEYYSSVVVPIFGGETTLEIPYPVEPDTDTPDSDLEEIPEQKENLYELLKETEYNLDRLTSKQIHYLKQRVLGDRVRVKSFCGVIKNKYGTKCGLRHRFYRISEINQKGDFISNRGEHIKPHYVDV